MSYTLKVIYSSFTHEVDFYIAHTGVHITRYAEVILDKIMDVTDDIDDQFIAKELQFWLLHQDRRIWGSNSHSLTPQLSEKHKEMLEIFEVLNGL